MNFFSTKSPRLQTSSLTLQALIQQISTCCTPHTLITEVSFRLCNSCSSSSQAQRNRSVRIPREGWRFFGMLPFDSCPEISAEKFGNLIEYLRWRGVKGQKNCEIYSLVLGILWIVKQMRDTKAEPHTVLNFNHLLAPVFHLHFQSLLRFTHFSVKVAP